MAQKFLAIVAGKLKEVFAAVTSAGAADAGKVVALDANGLISSTMISTSATHSIPSGGTTGQILSKINNTDYNAQWVTPSSSGSSITLLGTLTTTSGTTQTLASLTLTSYSLLKIFVKDVSLSASGAGVNLGGLTLVPASYNSDATYKFSGVMDVDLSTGLFGFSLSLADGSGNYLYGSGVAGTTAYRTSSTSIVFASTTSATFDGGSIKIYGVK